MLIFCLSIAMLWCLNYFDALTTYILVCRSGTKREKNPIVRWFMNRFGVKKGLILAKGIIFLLAPLIIYVYIFSPIEMIIALQVLNILYAVVVYHNVRQV